MLMLDELIIFLVFVMQTEEERKSNSMDQIAELIAGIFFIIQFLVFMYSYNFQGIELLRWFGWLLLIPGFLFITLSITSLKKHGFHEDGKSWVFTTVLVRQGVYGIVRHPFSLGWTMLAIALALVSQFWLSINCMIVQLPLIIFYSIHEEKKNIQRFGSDYLSYQQRVPMMNFFAGLKRNLMQKRTNMSDTG